MQESLRSQLGPNLEQAVKEVLAVAWYQSEKLSIGQVAEFLGVSIYEAEGMMKRLGVEAPYSLEEYEHDRQMLERLLKS